MRSLSKNIVPRVLGIAAFAISGSVFSQELPSGKINAKVFANWHQDFYGQETSTFDLTRAYLGFSYAHSENISSKLVLDVGRLNEMTGATIDTSTGALTSRRETRYEAFLKNAFIEWKGLIPATSLEVGMVNNKLMYMHEKYWGYRYIYKSFMDENRFTPYSDLGANAVISPISGLKINLSLLNGEGFTAPQDENGEYKAGGGVEANLPFGLSMYAFTDYMPIQGKEAQSTYTGFIGYEMKNVVRIGGEIDYLMNTRGVQDAHLMGLSVYGAFLKIAKYEVFARYDVLTSENDWNKNGYDGQAALGGVQYSPVNGLKVAANYQVVMPDADNVDSQSKVFLNFEFSY